jgi:hypothetical protein
VRGAGLLLLMDGGGEVEVAGGEGHAPSSPHGPWRRGEGRRSWIWPAAPCGRAATARDNGDSTTRARATAMVRAA